MNTIGTYIEKKLYIIYIVIISGWDILFNKKIMILTHQSPVQTP